MEGASRQPAHRLHLMLDGSARSSPRICTLLQSAMAIELLPLTSDRLTELETLLLPVWQRRWDRLQSERIFRWRFLERPEGEGLIAYDNGRAVGFIDSFFRQYRTRAGLIRVREPADWYCHPSYRPLLSIRLIRKLMQSGEALLVVGGNPNTRNVLPKLGYKALPDVASYMLPTGTGAFAKVLAGTVRFPLHRVPRFLIRPLSVRTLWGGRAHRSSLEFGMRQVQGPPPMPEASTNGGSYGLAPVFPTEEHDWFRNAPGRMGEFMWFEFETAHAKGLSFVRLYQDGPFRAARILHIEASRPSVLLYDSILRGTIGALLPYRPQWITARFTSPMARQAIQSAGFKGVGAYKAFWWHRDIPPPEGPLHLSWTTSDEGLLPYPN